jgi:hypothetical protein
MVEVQVDCKAMDFENLGRKGTGKEAHGTECFHKQVQGARPQKTRMLVKAQVLKPHELQDWPVGAITFRCPQGTDP